MSDVKTTSTGGAFKFVGGMGGRAGGDKISWPLVVQASIIKAYLTTKDRTAKEIFAEHLPLLNEERVKASLAPITELPQSYINNNAGSLLHGLRSRFLKRVNKGDKATLTVAEQFGLVEAATQAANANKTDTATS